MDVPSFPVVTLRVDHAQHERIRIQFAIHDHGENPGAAAGDQRNTAIILFYRLLLIAAVNVPEHEVRELVAGRRVASVINAGPLQKQLMEFKTEENLSIIE